MNITEYGLIYDEDFHPTLKTIEKFDWPYMDDDNIQDIEDLAWMLQEKYRMSDLAEEFFYVISLDVKWRVKGVCQLAHGSSQKVDVGMRELFIFLLLTGADAFVVAHNHPDGELEVSDNDYALTDFIKRCSELLDIEFLEHFILSRKGYFQIIDNIEFDTTKLRV